MQTRHRIPTIFNLSMVDVLCCALGCVILLWLLNYREARRRTVAAGATGQRLAEVSKDLAEHKRRAEQAAGYLEGMGRELDVTAQLARVLQQEYDDVQGALEKAHKHGA